MRSTDALVGVLFMSTATLYWVTEVRTPLHVSRVPTVGQVGGLERGSHLNTDNGIDVALRREGGNDPLPPASELLHIKEVVKGDTTFEETIKHHRIKDEMKLKGLIEEDRMIVEKMRAMADAQRKEKEMENKGDGKAKPRVASSPPQPAATPTAPSVAKPGSGPTKATNTTGEGGVARLGKGAVSQDRGQGKDKGITAGELTSAAADDDDIDVKLGEASKIVAFVENAGINGSQPGVQGPSKNAGFNGQKDEDESGGVSSGGGAGGDVRDKDKVVGGGKRANWDEAVRGEGGEQGGQWCSGDELDGLGHWVKRASVPRPVGYNGPTDILEYHLDSCKLKRYTQEEARECFSNRHVMIIGDSLSRFQYMNLVYFLYKAWPEDSGLVEGAFNPCREAWGQGGWGFFYPNSSSGLEGTEWCDCYRNDGPMSAKTQNSLVENRYFHLESHNLSVSYLQQFGSLPMRGHYAGQCNGKGSVQLKMGEVENDKKKLGSCGPDGMTKEALAKEGKVLDDRQFHKNADAKFDWSGMIGDVFKYVLPHMGVDTLFWNSGIWLEYHDESEVAQLMRLGTAALVPHGRGGPETYWKTTTAKKKCHKIGKKCLLHDKKEIVVFNDTIPNKVARASGWGIYDAQTPTKILPMWVWTDEVHYKPFVYRELNNLLLNKVCNARHGFRR